MTQTEPSSTLLRPGDTCWRIARTDRIAVIIDASDYFATIRAAVQTAQHSVYLIGWDFDTRIELDRPGDDSEVPNTLGAFLKWVIREHSDLRIYMLRWNLGAINALGRGTTPVLILDWMTDDRIRFKLDAAHPVGSAHHQKIVVIDDALAFCGGIDMTGDRWDTRDHLDDNPARVRPTTRRQYGPWHDVTTAVDGEAARALGDLARMRWKHATGEDLEPPPPITSAWPERLAPLARDLDVALSRTAPEHDGREGIFEIEAIYLAGIAAARRTIYIESQYFASRAIAEAIEARLREADGPEVVVINPESADGWLEEEVMGSARARLMQRLARADLHDRFRLYTPVTAGGKPIYVHAKVMVIDDQILKVGSSNLNNRSLGFDTECDLTVEATHARPDLSQAIARLRNDLLAEHLDVSPEQLGHAIDRAHGSLIGAIEALRSAGRSLVPFVPPHVDPEADPLLDLGKVLDPERPTSGWRGVGRTIRGWVPKGA